MTDEVNQYLNDLLGLMDRVEADLQRLTTTSPLRPEPPAMGVLQWKALEEARSLIRKARTNVADVCLS